MALFKDLTEERQREIVVDYMPDDWHDYIIEEACKSLGEVGFEGVAIDYTGWYSQGDGASFTCDSIDFEKFWKHESTKGNWDFDMGFTADSIDDELDRETAQALGFVQDSPLIELIKNGFWYGRVSRHNHRYCHERSTGSTIECEGYSIVEEGEENYDNYDINQKDEAQVEYLTQYLSTYIDEWMVSRNRKIYDSLQTEWENWVDEEFKWRMADEETDWKE